MNCEFNFGEKERLTDTITSQKMISSTYDTFTNECVSEELMNTMLTILDDEHKIQHALFKEMQNRGWYTPENAEQNKIEKEKNKYSSECAACAIN